MKVSLVKLAQADLPFLTELLNQPEAAKWLWWEQRYRREWEIIETLTESKQGCETHAFGIYSGSDVVGCVSYQDICPTSRSATIGNVAVSNPYYALAAGGEIARYGFNVLNLNRLDCRFIEGCRLTPLMLRRVGGKHEGTLRELIYQDGEYKDVQIWSLLRSEWNGSSTD